MKISKKPRLRPDHGGRARLLLYGKMDLVFWTPTMLEKDRFVGKTAPIMAKTRRSKIEAEAVLVCEIGASERAWP